MDESNSQPTRCPCGFFGSQQTLGLCSKCFREREENCNQATADIPRSSVTSDLARQVMASSANGGDGSRQSNGTSSGEPQNKKSDQPRSTSNSVDQSLSLYRVQQSTSLPLNVAPDKMVPNVSAANKTSSSVDADPDSTGACSCSNDAAEKRLVAKRKHSEVSVESEESQPTKRRRSANPNSHCHQCNCRLELAIQAMGKCKCGCVFCQLHRLPEQHDCSFDHKEEGRREARAKMVPARKHVGTTLKRLDSDS